MPAEDGEDGGERRRGLFRRLRDEPARDARGVGVFTRSLAGPSDWEALEEALILADVGARRPPPRSSASSSGSRAASGSPTTSCRERLARCWPRSRVPASGGRARIDLRAQPSVVLMVGVNGTGKTTTLGKLAWQLREHFGLRVLLGAADTYRAAATEQLEAWAAAPAARSSPASPAPIPGAVAFEAVATGARRRLRRRC